jgi:hypothetical protein
VKQHPTRAFVYPVKEHTDSIEKLRQLIRAACDLVCDDSGPADPKRCLQQADVLVILICPETMDSAPINELIILASHTGKRIVGVWAPGIQHSEVPAALHKHGDAAIVFDADAVKKVVCGGESIWSTPVGAPRPSPKTPRHKG